jgi:arylsulfatase A-like enzyme
MAGSAASARRLAAVLARSAARLAAVAALVLGLGCEPDAGSPEPAARAEAVSLDLAARTTAADFHRATASANLCGPDANHQLTSGWYAWEEDAGWRFTGPRDAVVEVPIVSPRDAVLHLSLEPVVELEGCPTCQRSKKPVQQTVRVVWNGRDLGTHELAPGFELDLPIPAGEQRVGPNRLELQPNWWLRPHFHPFPDDPRTLGFACRRIELRAGGEPPGDEASGGFARGGRVVQPPGSVITFHVTLPERARLVARAAARGGRSGGAGRIAISLLERDGTVQQVGAAEIAGESKETDSIAIAADLGAHGERMASLSLAYTGRGEEPAPTLEWQELRIEGVSEPGPSPTPVAIPRRRYNVFILLLDSLRADHVQPYGPDSLKTPSMARLAEEGVTFLGARSNASWTRPAVASLLTSRTPSAHGVQEMAQRLSRKIPLLPAMLRRRGYRTVGMTATAVISPSFGFARGFQHMHRHFILAKSDVWPKTHPTPESRARFVWKHYLARTLLRGNAERPFFAYVHEIDPHSPYEPEPPYDTLHEAPYPGNITLDLATIGRIRDDPSWADPMDIRHLNAQYQGEVSFMDRYVGWIVERLDEAGLGQQTLFVLVSDHGEEFMEHRSVGHAHTVYEELLRIPLILRLPGALPAGLRLDVGAQLIDLAPTILDLIGEPIPEWMEGRSLLPFIEAPDREPPLRPAFASSNGPRHETVRLGRWKLIRDDPEDPRTPHRHRLFDLESDPDETVDLWSRELVVGQALRQLLEAKLAGDAAQRTAPTERVEHDELDADELEGLRALGYLE